MYSQNHCQMKIIENHKFILRPATLEDAKDLFEYYNQEKALKYLPIKVHKSIKDTEEFIKEFFLNNYSKGLIGHWIIFYKEDNKVIGHLGLNNVIKGAKEAEIGIAINPSYWGKGLASELTLFTIKYAFDNLKIEKLIALTNKENKYTRKSLTNLGFKYKGIYINREKIDNRIEYIVCDRYELQREEYKLEHG